MAAFIKRGAKKDLGKMKALLKDSNKEVRHAGAEAFGKFGTRTDFVYVKALMMDSSEETRCKILEAFGKVGAREDLGQVLKFLGDSDSNVQRAVKEVVATIASDLSKEEAVKLLTNEYLYIRKCAKRRVRELVGDDKQQLREFLDRSVYPLDVTLYFEMAIENPGYFDEVNQRSLEASENPIWQRGFPNYSPHRGRSNRSYKISK